MEQQTNKEITHEVIETFLNGHDPEERIVNLEYNYKDDFIQVYYRNERDQRCVREEPFYPFLWATRDACVKLCHGNRRKTRELLNKYGIEVKKLRTEGTHGERCEEMENGFCFKFFALRPMSYSKFLEFFKVANNPVYKDKKNDSDSFTFVPTSQRESRQYTTVTPQEQFLMSTGKRFFKGYDDYDQLLKCTIDLETTGLNVKTDRILQFGIRFNRPVRRVENGEMEMFQKVLYVTGNTKEELDKSELNCIKTALSIIRTYDPDVVTAHNGENFDWNLIINACERLGTTMEKVSSPYFKGGKYIRKNQRESILKLGGEIEKFNQTVIPGRVVTDSLHAVRRAQATDSNFLRADLKYATKYLKLKKEDRVYTPGDKIGEILKDEVEHYAFNPKNGDWYLYDKNAPSPKIYEPEFDLEHFKNEYENENAALTNGALDQSLYENYIDELKEKIVDWHFDHDTQDISQEEIESWKSEFSFREYLEHIADEEQDGFMIKTILESDDWEEVLRPHLYDDYIEFLKDRAEEYNVEGFDFCKDNVTDEEIEEWKQKYTYKDFITNGEPLKTPEERYSEYLQEIEEKNRMKLGKDGDKPFIMYTRNFVADGYELVSGKYIVERYLLDDLWECDKVEYNLNGTDFMLCKIIPVTYQKCCTMGTAGQWKAIMLAWSYENDLAIPLAENTGSFTGGLSRLLSVGYKELVAKFDYNSLYPSIILTWAISDKTDLLGGMLYMLEYVLTTREKYKGIKKAAEKKCDFYKKKIACGEVLTESEKNDYDQAFQDFKINDNRQMSVKKLGNSFFGSYGSNNGSVFPWKSVDCAERTTCTGRMCLRLMISHFHNLGYEPIVGDTDGFDFGLPKGKPYRFTDDNPYVSPGLSRETKEGVSYTGYKADVAEFNDLFMKDFHYAPNAVNKMGLGIDEVLDSSINFSRKNYCCWFPENPYPDDVKRVGNTIKSKKMPEYIERFLDKGVRLLLQKKGQEFIEEYYSYVEKIYNCQIPWKQIASKGKIKKTLNEYIEDCKTVNKAGNAKSRQAWMELAIRDGIDVNLGDTIYYINIGTKKSQKDTNRVTHYYINTENGKESCITALQKEYNAKKKSVDVKEGRIVLLPFKDYVKKYHQEVIIEDEVFLNCMRLPTEIIESESDYFGDCDYNIPKYVEAFNNRIKPLLVCFSPEIRNKIIIENPKDRQYFTQKECELSSGYPNKPSDQDTYTQLMTMDDKEIKFWLRHPEWKIPFIDECGMNWDDIVKDYEERMERNKRVGADLVIEEFNKALQNLSKKDIDDFVEEGSMPKSIEKLVDVDPITGNFVHKEYHDIVIGTLLDVIAAMDEKLFGDDYEETE